MCNKPIKTDKGRAQRRVRSQMADVSRETWRLNRNEPERVSNAPRAKLLEEDALIHLVRWHALNEFPNLRLRGARNAQSEERPQRLAAIFPVRRRKIHNRFDVSLIVELVRIGE